MTPPSNQCISTLEEGGWGPGEEPGMPMAKDAF